MRHRTSPRAGGRKQVGDERTRKDLPGVHRMPKGEQPWLTSRRATAIDECVVLFIDKRGSSLESTERGINDKELAEKMGHLLSAVKGIHGRSGGPLPSLVKSLGDGVLLVWSCRSRDRKEMRQAVLEVALKLKEKLPQEVTKRWKEPKEVRLGMGLAAGCAAKMQVGGVRDYFGYTVNLAAKLQTLARPKGLVIDSMFFEKVGLKPPSCLELHDVPARIEISRSRKCFVSDSENSPPDWTCLAWPGLAEGVRDAKGRSWNGLSAHGITVLTHEGLSGKIGTLQLWDPEQASPQGDPLELIIDDLDTLETWSELKLLRLRKWPEHADTYLRTKLGVCESLAEMGSHANILFVPIRCGLNALVWNAKVVKNLGTPTSYGAVLQTLLDNTDGKRPKIALYDNLGASLPILLAALNSETLKEVYEGDASRVACALRKLDKLHHRRGGKPLFELYSEMHQLSTALRSKSIVVFGGGTWLLEKGSTVKEFRVSIPKEGALLWVEGAAVLDSEQVDWQRVANFFGDAALGSRYQKALPRVKPYVCLPVRRSVIEEQLCVSENRQSAHCRELGRIFSDGDRLNQDIVPRRAGKTPAEWLRLWADIKQRFCSYA